MPKTNTIALARQSDVSAVNSLQAYHALSAKQAAIGKRVRKTGFLIHLLSLAEIKRTVGDRNALFLVSKKGKKVNGYFLAYDMRGWFRRNPNWVFYASISPAVLRQINGGKAVYFRHIAINKKAGGRREVLEHEMFRKASERGFEYAFGEVLIKPERNDAQFRSLVARGYDVVGERTEKLSGNNLVWAIVRRKL